MRIPFAKTPLLVIALAASQCGANDCGEIIRDPGFDLWCGDQLCRWKVARGTVGQVATWHEGDDGVDMLGGDTAIYQLSPVTSGDGACIEFELVVDVDPGVDLRFQADVYGDGSIEVEETIPSAEWRPLTYRFAVDGVYQGIRFWIVKGSVGHAVVAQLQARTCDDGVTVSRHVSGGPAPDGAKCLVGSDCANAICEQFPTGFPPPATCGECEVGTTCPNAGDVCGYAPPLQFTLAASTECVPTASKQLGDACAVNAECAQGSCPFGVCSTCFGGSCGGGEACEGAGTFPIPEGGGRNYPVPLVCSPAGAVRAPGEPCFTNGDCTSGSCAGTPRTICEDGRACTDDSDCPIRDGLEHQLCATVGLIGGTCQ